eukprot:TRINITY_DN10603_c0_g1_i1.p1 TRINITY_DN10603_c0_g1~~TRINITY_DN10603_c0_g1_i1.p1  ORF type:complete len:191 (-),score=28.28 TRINITY_DN10603_c0_g1_i1:34-606(-)
MNQAIHRFGSSHLSTASSKPSKASSSRRHIFSAISPRLSFKLILTCLASIVFIFLMASWSILYFDLFPKSTHKLLLLYDSYWSHDERLERCWAEIPSVPRYYDPDVQVCPLTDERSLVPWYRKMVLLQYVKYKVQPPLSPECVEYISENAATIVPGFSFKDVKTREEFEMLSNFSSIGLNGEIAISCLFF